MALSDSAGLLFKIKGDASDAIRALNQTQREAKDLTSTTAGLGAGLRSLAVPAALAAAGVAAVGASAVAVGAALFNLSQRAAAYGSEIFNASVKTGLTTETISALKLASERTGVSMESLGTIVNRFSRVVGEAAQGSDQAAETLKRLGITPQEAIANLDIALGKVFQRIQDLPDPISKATLAQQAFGKAGTELLKVIDDFNGDLPKAIEHARKLGLVMSKEDAAAADEFGDQMDTLNHQLRGVGFTIGRALMPVFLDMAKSMSDFFSRNQAEIKAWANTVSLTLQGLMLQWGDLKKAADDYYITTTIGALASLDPLARHVHALGELARARAAAERAITSGQLRSDFTIAPPPTTAPPTPNDALTNFDALAAAQRPAKVNTIQIDQARSTQAEIAKAQLESFTETLKREFDLWDAQQQTILARFKADLAIKAISEKEYQKQVRTYEDERLAGQLANLELEKKKRAELGYNTRQIDNDIAIKREEIDRKMQERREKDADRQREDEKKELEHLEKKYESWKRHIEQLERVQELADIEQQRRYEEEKAAQKREDQQRLDSLGGGFGGGFLGGLGLSVEELIQPVSILQQMGEILANTFQQVASAVGEAVKAFVLFGGTGGSIKKFVAEVIASIAQMAAVEAVWNLAKGFAMLALNFFWPDPRYAAAAAMHFKAAAVFGGIALATAVAGRAVAGDSFKQQTAGGGVGGATGTSRAARDTSGQGQAFSSREAYLQEEGRNAPLGVDVRIKFEDKPAWFTQMFVSEWRANGRIRRLVEDGR